MEVVEAAKDLDHVPDAFEAKAADECASESKIERVGFETTKMTAADAAAVWMTVEWRSDALRMVFFVGKVFELIVSGERRRRTMALARQSHHRRRESCPVLGGNRKTMKNCVK